MRKSFSGSISLSVFLFLRMLSASAEDLSGVVKKAVEKSTLDQPGTRPFHLKAAYAPSFERDRSLHRVGEIEIWWQSPTRWRREVSSPEFHQIAIEIRPTGVEPYGAVEMPRVVSVLKDGKVGLRLTVNHIGTLDRIPPREFIVKGHEWQRAFTAEAR